MVDTDQITDALLVDKIDEDVLQEIIFQSHETSKNPIICLVRGIHMIYSIIVRSSTLGIREMMDEHEFLHHSFEPSSY
ncbi:hypothetical protein MPTK1_6g15650 [Marchantia polymorpha subsp. ruderalis]|uniref:Uncharacterized protein n=2 Tax=Marchantia polymorpha TaxID=3197 RepID=A0AAF6BSF6_MARPO|nr:hypothetical protein MARPO_0056s0077 [Marchantia polymorpha]BBN14939.1 hypothetical protein Mp_6g15650 [Marchantia polymorpha subsp. ruderalis]PTQ37623.1 hypothetical protein MARPO_0056s0077 [Marchantia polymorpha]PTQ37624.1 hypothetical protein MARPO_0056s0077 [Marchantia polymorpha]PTQ37626.1 hypothetical protein MARPO_0056s0077 [Marchantia polymorpha]|eukprot:PTQ37620.1 hypothetical protein MARPO_0056s0077 [Marchantia polymorpha]